MGVSTIIRTIVTSVIGAFTRWSAHRGDRGRFNSEAPVVSIRGTSIIDEMTRRGAIYFGFDRNGDGEQFWEVVDSRGVDITLERIECRLAGIMPLQGSRATVVPIPGALVGVLCSHCGKREETRPHLDRGGHPFVPGRRTTTSGTLRLVDGSPSVGVDGTSLVFLGSSQQWAARAGGECAA